MRQRVESQRNEPTQCLRCLFMATAIEKNTLIIDVTWYFTALYEPEGTNDLFKNVSATAAIFINDLSLIDSLQDDVLRLH
jgi:hypothetical protein